MLLRRRRLHGVLALLVLATPLVIGLLLPDGEATVLREGRRLAPAPARPASLAELDALPGEVDAYLKDRFGLRRAMIRAHRDLTKPMFGFGGANVLIGRDGRMFYLGDEMVRQSAGLVLRDERVSEAVGFLAEMAGELKSRGKRFLVAIPPNASTIYQDDLPDWAQKGDRQTEYDLLLRGLAGRGVETVDLRPPVAAVRSAGEAYYRRDTHWTWRAALAAFDAIVEADGHPHWRLDPSVALGPPVPHKEPDLVRMSGVDDGKTDSEPTLSLPPRGQARMLSGGSAPAFALFTGEPGPTVMVIGDSFTESYFPPMLAQHSGTVIWLHYRQCGFDWKWIEKFKPDEVWWTPTERALLCDRGKRPIGFPVRNAAAK